MAVTMLAISVVSNMLFWSSVLANPTFFGQKLIPSSYMAGDNVSLQWTFDLNTASLFSLEWLYNSPSPHPDNDIVAVYTATVPQSFDQGLDFNGRVFQGSTAMDISEAFIDITNITKEDMSNYSVTLAYDTPFNVIYSESLALNNIPDAHALDCINIDVHVVTDTINTWNCKAAINDGFSVYMNETFRVDFVFNDTDFLDEFLFVNMSFLTETKQVICVNANCSTNFTFISTIPEDPTIPENLIIDYSYSTRERQVTIPIHIDESTLTTAFSLSSSGPTPDPTGSTLEPIGSTGEPMIYHHSGFLCSSEVAANSEGTSPDECLKNNWWMYFLVAVGGLAVFIVPPVAVYCSRKKDKKGQYSDHHVGSSPKVPHSAPGHDYIRPGPQHDDHDYIRPGPQHDVHMSGPEQQPAAGYVTDGGNLNHGNPGAAVLASQAYNNQGYDGFVEPAPDYDSRM